MAANPMTRDQVLKLQRTLRDAGYYPGAIDGHYGPQTQAAHTRYLNEPPPDVPPLATPAKPWWLSRTIVGVVGTVIVGALGVHGVDASQITDWLMQAIELGFATLAIWGRIRADRPIAPVRLPGRAGDAGRLRGGAVDLSADRRNQVVDPTDDAGRGGWGDR